jgi:hypothetical protein
MLVANWHREVLIFPILVPVQLTTPFCCFYTMLSFLNLFCFLSDLVTLAETYTEYQINEFEMNVEEISTYKLKLSIKSKKYSSKLITRASTI